MSFAIISDIHGNLEALETVLKDIDSVGVDRIICLGDIVGYGPNPIECTEIVHRVCDVCLCGNHDVALLSQAFGFNKYARAAIDWTREVMRPGSFSLPGVRTRWNFIQTSPDSYMEDGILMVHASPRDPVMEYIEPLDVGDPSLGPSDKIVEIFDLIEHICFIGHTHKPGVFTGDFHFITPVDLTEMTYEAPTDQKTLINVGSVGQPRDRDPKSCYVVVDVPRITFHKVEYDIDKEIARFTKVPELDARLGERLRIGR